MSKLFVDEIVNRAGTGAPTFPNTEEALNNILPDQTGNAGKVLKTDGTNASWEEDGGGGGGGGVTPVAGGVVWTDANSMEVTPAGTSGQLLRSNGTSAPTWSNDLTAKTLTTIGNEESFSIRKYKEFNPGWSPANLTLYSAQGTIANPEPLENGDWFGSIKFNGFSDPNATTAVELRAVSTDFWSDTITPCELQIHHTGQIALLIDEARRVTCRYGAKFGTGSEQTFLQSYAQLSTSVTFTGNGSGAVTSSAVQLRIQRVGNWVTVFINPFFANGGSGSVTLMSSSPALPTWARPTTLQRVVGGSIHNVVPSGELAVWEITTGGILNLGRNPYGTTFSASSNCGLSAATTITYYVG